MKLSRIENYFRGWFVGDFEPTCHRTSDFEVGLLTHKKDEVWPAHYHKVATEINLLIEGEMTINDHKLSAGDIFVISPNEVANPIFHTDCKLVVIKTPSLTTDKYIV